MTPRSKAVYAVLGASFLGILNYALAKYISTEIPALTQSWLKFLWGTVFAVVLFRGKNAYAKLWSLSHKDWVLLITLGFVGWGFAKWAIIEALTHTTLANVSFVEAFLPIVVYTFSVLLFMARPSIWILLSVLVSTYGLLIINNDTFVPAIQAFATGEALVLVAVAATAVGYIIRKYLRDAINTYLLTTTSIGIGCIALTPFVLFSDPVSTLMTASIASQGILLLTGFFLTLSVALFTYALGHISATLASQLGLTKVLYAIVLGLLFFGEIPTITDLIGGLCIIAGVHATNTIQSRQEKKN